MKLADGTTVSMPDTEENQEAYPQPASQEKGLGFPVARMVVLLLLATAMVCGMAIGPYSGKETEESALLCQSLDQLEAGDILPTDKYFCSDRRLPCFGSGILILSRLHHARKEDAYRIKRLGKKDHLIQWQRPAKPDWMDPDTYERMPASLTLRSPSARYGARFSCRVAGHRHHTP